MCTFFVLLCVIYRLTGNARDQLQRAENSERPEGRKHAGENNGGGTDVCRIFHFPPSWLRRITWGWKDLRRPPLRHLEASHKGGTWKNCVKVKIHRICKYLWKSPPTPDVWPALFIWRRAQLAWKQQRPRCPWASGMHQCVQEQNKLVFTFPKIFSYCSLLQRSKHLSLGPI